MLIDVTPVIEFCVDLRAFYNVDLAQRGYYQLRTRLKPPPKYAQSLVDVHIPRSVASALFPAAVVNGQAVGKTIEIVYADETVRLDDRVNFTVHLPVRMDKFAKSCIEFTLVLELWFIEKDKMLSKELGGCELHSAFRCLSRRDMLLKFRMSHGLNYHRPVLFDYYHLGAVTATIHASLIAADSKVKPKRRRSESSTPPDSPSAEKLRTYHKSVCRCLLTAYDALQSRIRKYIELFPAQYSIRLQIVDVDAKLEALHQRLNESRNGWDILEEDRQALSKELTAMFGQFLELFRSYPEVDQSLHNEHHHGRVKRFAEGFFCVEDTMHTLIANGFSSSTQSLSLQARIVDILKKSTYFNGLPELIVGCPELDGTADSTPIIFEERYFPLASSARASRLPSTDTPDASMKNRKVSSGRFSPEKVARALKSSLCLDLRHLNKPASSADDDVYLMASKSGDDCDSYIHGAAQTAAPDDVRLLTVESGGCASATSTLSDASSVPPPTYPPDKRNIVRRSTEPNLVLERERETSFLEGVGVGRAHSDSAVNGVTLLLSDCAIAPFDCAKTNVSCKQQIPVVHESSSLCCMSICSQNGRQQTSQPCKESKPEEETNDTNDDNDFTTVTTASVDAHVLARVDDTVVEFVRNKELFKEKLSLSGYNGHLCSDFAQLASRIPYFSRWDPHSTVQDHLVVCVHGLDGSIDDLRPYRTYLKLALQGNVSFLMSEANQSETFNDMTAMAGNLVDEILVHLEGLAVQPKRISFIAHSLGTVITRAALAEPRLAHLMGKMHCFLSLNGPHCGLLYNQRAANWGVSFVQWWKRSRSLEQLTMRDQPISALRESFLYRLSQNGSLGVFRYVLLVGSNQDMYVPCHSALIQPCKDAQKDSSPFGAVYGELVTNIVESVASSARHTTLVKYTAFHGMANVSRTHQIMGRAAHIAVLDDDLFIEKLLTVSALKYFA